MFINLKLVPHSSPINWKCDYLGYWKRTGRGLSLLIKFVHPGAGYEPPGVNCLRFLSVFYFWKEYHMRLDSGRKKDAAIMMLKDRTKIDDLLEKKLQFFLNFKH